MRAKITAPRVLGATALYLGVTYASYRYIRATLAPVPDPPASGSRSFEQLASCYDRKGDVLEISAGTGRNLKYYNYNNINSLVLSDLSGAMLEQAETKYYDDLKIPFRHPAHTATFCVADAHCMCHQSAADGMKPHVPPSRLQPSHPVGLPDAVQMSSPANHGPDAGQSATRSALQPATQSQEQTSAHPSSQGTSNTTTSTPPPQQGSSFAQRFFQAFLKASQLDGEAHPVPQCRPGQRPHPQHTGQGSEIKISDPQPTGQGSVSTPGEPIPGWSTAQGGCGCSSQQPAESSYRDRCSSANSRQLGLRQFPEDSFDTVVDTFGLCSHEDPVVVLKEAARLCKPGGRIILLEHGRGRWQWLNRQLDDSAEQHHSKWGCWWNRDILQLVQQAGLEVESVWRWHFGTTYMVWARPGPAHTSGAMQTGHVEAL